MTIPNLKRVKISKSEELDVWLRKNCDYAQSIMLVLFDQSSGEKFIPVEIVNELVLLHGWQSGRRYTLNGNLIGHVISPK